jgi:hypothetical protein
VREVSRQWTPEMKRDDDCRYQQNIIRTRHLPVCNRRNQGGTGRGIVCESANICLANTDESAPLHNRIRRPDVQTNTDIILRSLSNFFTANTSTDSSSLFPLLDLDPSNRTQTTPALLLTMPHSHCDLLAIPRSVVPQRGSEPPHLHSLPPLDDQCRDWCHYLF